MSTEVCVSIGGHGRPILLCDVQSASVARAAMVFGFLITLLSLPTLAGDPYLDAINAEGDRLETLGYAKKEQELLIRGATSSASTPTANRTPGPALSARPAGPGGAPSVKSTMDFENVLHENFPGSFALYSMLDNKEKESVFNEYQKSRSEGPGRFLPVVSKIIALITIRNRDRRAPSR